MGDQEGELYKQFANIVLYNIQFISLSNIVELLQKNTSHLNQ